MHVPPRSRCATWAPRAPRHCCASGARLSNVRQEPRSDVAARLETAVIVDEQRPARARQVRDQHQRPARELDASFIVDEQRPARANADARAAPVNGRALPMGREPRDLACSGALPLRAAPTSGCACSVILRDVDADHAVLLEEIRHDGRSLVAAGAHPFKRELVGATASRRDLRRRSRTVHGRTDPPPTLHSCCVAGGGYTGRSQRRAAPLESVAS